MVLVFLEEERETERKWRDPIEATSFVYGPTALTVNDLISSVVK